MKLVRLSKGGGRGFRAGGRGVGDHLLPFHIQHLPLQLRELASFSTTSAKEAKKQRLKYTLTPLQRQAVEAVLKNPEEAPRTSFPWHRLIEFWWASDCSTVNVPRF